MIHDRFANESFCPFCESVWTFITNEQTQKSNWLMIKIMNFTLNSSFWVCEDILFDLSKILDFKADTYRDQVIIKKRFKSDSLMNHTII